MDDPNDTAVSIAHVIQLAVAPVFLLSGIAAMLAVLTNRLARIVDRGRKLEEEFPQSNEWRMQQLRVLLKTLSIRARLISRAISLCIGSAVLVGSLVVLLFISSLLHVNFGPAVATLFIGAMLSLISGLLFFLREILLATRHLRIGEPEQPATLVTAKDRIEVERP